MALPVAPLILIVQGLGLFLRGRWRRLFGIVCCSLIGTMTVLAWTLDTHDPGANIGGGILIFWLALSVIMLTRALEPRGRGSEQSRPVR